MRIDNVLFDLDGTLVDSSPGIEFSVAAAVAAVMPTRQLNDLRKFIGPPIREVLKRAMIDVGAEQLDEIESAFRASYNAEGWRKSVAYMDVEQVLEHLAQWSVKCFVVTNKPCAPTKMILDELGLTRHFIDIVSPDSIQPSFASKADAARHIIRKHKLDVDKTLLVGDAVDDARAAQACGIRFAAVTYGYGEPRSQHDAPVHLVLNDASGLLSAVFEHNRAE